MKESFELLVISDSHGRPDAIRAVLSEWKTRPYALLFLGDGLRDMTLIQNDEKYENLTVYAVSGNCDRSLFFPADEPEVRMVQLGEVRVLMMHGDTFDVKWGLSEAIAYAVKKQADVLLYGHTHVPYERLLPAGERLRDGTVLEKPLLVANPGSLGAPRGSDEPSFGVLTVRGNSVLFSHGTL